MTTHDPQKEKVLNDDYLWDRSGAPDPEIQRLESLFAEFRHQDRALTLPAEVRPGSEGAPSVLRLLQKGWELSWLPRLAAVAVILLTFSVSIYFALRPSNLPDANSAWDVSTLEGAPQIGSQAISASAGGTKLRVGQTLTTDSTSRASISQNDLGEIRVDPDSRVRLLQSGPNRKRIQLDVGTIHAAIWAPPTQFVVDTPSATAVDLGCAYTLQVAPDGSGTLRTTLGWVGFHLHGRDSFIPAGAMCATRPATGPGTPYFEDASPAFREALAHFDSEAQGSPEASPALSAILAEARPRDALSLWHLLSRTSGVARGSVYDRLAALVPAPSGVTRDGILQLNPQMLDLYWNALNLGDISIWRFWEQNSSPNSSPSPQMLEKKQLLLKKAP
jgi:hypothetical protein